jgi:prevent-host-death family protein
MGATVLRNPRGERIAEVSASDAKNAFGRVLDTVARTGMVAITRHAQPRAVLLSLEEYRALTQGGSNLLAALQGEFDAMLDRMNAPGQREAMQKAFDTPSAELGRAAVKGARRKRA